MREENITHVIVEHPYYGLAASKACKALNANLIIHPHNIESQRFRQLSKWWWSMLKTYEKWVHRKADFNLFKTHADLEYAIREFGLQRSKCLVIPYGVENFTGQDHLEAQKDIRRLHEIPAEEKIILFAGTLDYLPNADAVGNIYREIAPRLIAEGIPFRILICGRLRNADFNYLYSYSYSHPNVQMVGEVEEIEPYFAAADLFINPVLTGAGIQTKTIDALAHDCNVVCFEGMVDNELIGVSGGKLFLSRRDDWDDFIIQLKSGWNQELKTPIEFFNKYSWEKNVEKLASLIPSL
jgi:glycosyltransferase involved in cell wall biosynthesis